MRSELLYDTVILPADCFNDQTNSDSFVVRAHNNNKYGILCCSVVRVTVHENGYNAAVKCSEK